jgi:hypothetical protein
VFSSLQKKRETVSAPNLSVTQLAIFQEALQNRKLPTQDRILAGFVCFMVEGRLRCSDAQRLRDEPTLDLGDGGKGYIEARCGQLKSSAAKKQKGRALQVAGHSLDLQLRGWAKLWLALREEEGLHVRRDGCLQPQPMVGGGWTKARMSSADIGAYMRKTLAFGPSQLPKVTAHSCKATMLSWCAKAGVKKGVRRMLGYHASVGDSSMMAYSRDEMAGPLRELEKVIEAVRTGAFDPDATRSGRFRGSSSSDQLAVALPSRGAKRPRVEVEEQLALQVIKKKLHVVKKDGKTQCNRKIAEALYMKIDGSDPRASTMDYCDFCLAA